jgi:hypothetical protein
MAVRYRIRMTTADLRDSLEHFSISKSFVSCQLSIIHTERTHFADIGLPKDVSTTLCTNQRTLEILYDPFEISLTETFDVFWQNC